MAGDVGPRRPQAPPAGDPAGETGDLTDLKGGEFLDTRSYFGQLRRHHVNFLAERTKQRRGMISWILGLATGTVVASTFAMAGYIVSEWKHIASAVMVAWFSSVVAEVLGLVYIVATFLFPKDDHAVEQAIARETEASGPEEGVGL